MKLGRNTWGFAQLPLGKFQEIKCSAGPTKTLHKEMKFICAGTMKFLYKL